MVQEVHSFIRLRRRIRDAGRQFRRNNDNSTSLFHPTGGFVYAYDMSAVEEALDEYEQTLPTEYQEAHATLTIEQKLLKEAHTISYNHSEMDVRDFARSVAAYLVMNADPEKRRNPLRLMNVDYLEPVTDKL